MLEDLGDKIDLVLDGGPCTVGVESTIVACLDERPRLLRPGGIAREEIDGLLGRPLLVIDGPTARRPDGARHAAFALCPARRIAA